MPKQARQILYWSPRVLSLAVVWLAAKNFADWISPDKGFGDNVLSVLVHLIPAALVLGVVALSWRREWIAGTFFVLLGLLRAAKDVVVGSTSHLWLAAFGVFLGLLFVLSWKYRAELRGGPPPDTQSLKYGDQRITGQGRSRKGPHLRLRRPKRGSSC